MGRTIIGTIQEMAKKSVIENYRDEVVLLIDDTRYESLLKASGFESVTHMQTNWCKIIIKRTNSKNPCFKIVE